MGLANKAINAFANSGLNRRIQRDVLHATIGGMLGNETQVMVGLASAGLGVTTAAAKGAVKGTGKAAWKVGKAAAPHLVKAGTEAAYGAAELAGGMAIDAAEGYAAVSKGYSKLLDNTSVKLMDKAANIVGKHSNVVKYDEDGWATGLNKKGKAIGWGMVGAGALVSTINSYEDNHLGTFDSRIRSLTPDYSEYTKMKTPSASPMAAPAGADGSLVFALDRAKNGGFL